MMVIGLAGRRVDAKGTNPARFDPDPRNIKSVSSRLQATFVSHNATALVSSAACGADLLALEEAGKLGLRRRIVLPCSPDSFRSSSVVDRPGNWGSIFDRAVTEVDIRGDLIVLEGDCEDGSYLRVNHTIVEESILLGAALGCPVSALLVWEGRGRGAGDLTEEFGNYARTRGIARLEDVKTI